MYFLKFIKSITVQLHYVQNENFDNLFFGDFLFKKMGEKKYSSPGEKFWQKLVDTYFAFFKDHFRDEDGFRLSPDWSPAKRGMESKALKEIIIKLRTIAEEKNIEWTEEYAVSEFTKFLKKAHSVEFYRRGFLCCLLNKYKNQILTIVLNTDFVRKILEVWYFEFNGYARDYENDKLAADRIANFLKEQFVNNNLNYTEEAALASLKVLIVHIQGDEFWCNKSLKSISNHLQEFVNKIKNEKQRSGINRGSNTSKRPFSTSDSKTTALREWGVKSPGSGEAK